MPVNDRVPGIYKITTLHNNEFYIGSAIKPYKRRWEHLNMLKNNKHTNSHLQRVYNKYGIDNLKFNCLMNCDKEHLIELEQLFFDELNPYYNMQKIAGGSALGLKRSKETCEKISKARKGQLLSDEHKRKLTIGKKNYKGKIYQYDETNNLIKIWDMNIIDIEKTIGCCKGSLANTLCTNRKTLYGYVWKYEKEVTID